jgi:hypothetical protein
LRAHAIPKIEADRKTNRKIVKAQNKQSLGTKKSNKVIRIVKIQNIYGELWEEKAKETVWTRKLICILKRQIDRETERQRDRETERQRDRKTDKQKERKTERKCKEMRFAKKLPVNSAKIKNYNLLRVVIKNCILSSRNEKEIFFISNWISTNSIWKQDPYNNSTV